uniref:Uncharacterized protein n=1 Tax=Ulva partita TaxID=1605170 RepID=A0A1C9ZWB7_9CHLO|nr:hypothetical protein [Ulva partita]
MSHREHRSDSGDGDISHGSPPSAESQLYVILYEEDGNVEATSPNGSSADSCSSVDADLQMQEIESARRHSQSTPILPGSVPPISEETQRSLESEQLLLQHEDADDASSQGGQTFEARCGENLQAHVTDGEVKSRHLGAIRVPLEAEHPHQPKDAYASKQVHVVHLPEVDMHITGSNQAVCVRPHTACNQMDSAMTRATVEGAAPSMIRSSGSADPSEVTSSRFDISPRAEIQATTNKPASVEPWQPHLLANILQELVNIPGAQKPLQELCKELMAIPSTLAEGGAATGIVPLPFAASQDLHARRLVSLLQPLQNALAASGSHEQVGGTGTAEASSPAASRVPNALWNGTTSLASNDAGHATMDKDTADAKNAAVEAASVNASDDAEHSIADNFGEECLDDSAACLVLRGVAEDEDEATAESPSGVCGIDIDPGVTSDPANGPPDSINLVNVNTRNVDDGDAAEVAAEDSDAGDGEAEALGGSADDAGDDAAVAVEVSDDDAGDNEAVAFGGSDDDSGDCVESIDTINDPDRVRVHERRAWLLSVLQRCSLRAVLHRLLDVYGHCLSTGRDSTGCTQKPSVTEGRTLAAAMFVVAVGLVRAASDTSR